MWKQACGDPQNGVQPTGDGLQVQSCETGEWLEPKTEILDVLSRPYPRVAPGHLDSLTLHDGALILSGTATQESCDLEVWFPGAQRPKLDTTGVKRASIAQVDGGWLIRGCVAGAYQVTAQ